MKTNISDDLRIFSYYIRKTFFFAGRKKINTRTLWKVISDRKSALFWRLLSTYSRNIRWISTCEILNDIKTIREEKSMAKKPGSCRHFHIHVLLFLSFVKPKWKRIRQFSQVFKEEAWEWVEQNYVRHFRKKLFPVFRDYFNFVVIIKSVFKHD